jgi:hypothetical protein
MELFEHMRQTSTSQTQPLFLDKTDLLVLSQWSFLKPLLERERESYVLRSLCRSRVSWWNPR